MIVVLDSSAAIEILLNRQKAAQFKDIINAAEKVVTSDLYRIEIVNVLWKYVKAGFLEKDTANKLLMLAENLIDEFINIAENNGESLNESIRLNHSAYDMLYFTLARRMGAVLMTLDEKLMVLAKKEKITTVK